jgi:hypothetical protein
MCNCFEEYKEMAIIINNLGIPVNAEDVKVNWQNSDVYLSGIDKRCPVVIPLEGTFRSKNKNGVVSKNKSRKIVNVIINYCPFCGKEFKNEK